MFTRREETRETDALALPAGLGDILAGGFAEKLKR